MANNEKPSLKLAERCKSYESMYYDEETMFFDESIDDYWYSERRKSAIQKYKKKVKRLFLNKYPKETFLNAYHLLSYAPHRDTSLENSIFSPELGAAIWLLDYLNENKLFTELQCLLPSEFNPIEKYFLQTVQDCVYPDYLIASIVTVIMERDEKKNKNILDKIIRMIRKDDIIRLNALYEDGVFEFFEIFIKYSMVFDAKKEAEILEHTNRFNGSYHLLNMSKEEKENYFISEKEKIIDKYTESMSSFIFEAFRQMDLPHDFLQDRYGKELADMMVVFGRKNPYDICAAYLLNTINDDDILYLEYPSEAVLYNSVIRLPWNCTAQIENPVIDIIPDSYDMTYDKLPGDSEYDGYGHDKEKCNLHHIFFAMTGMLLPRKMRFADLNSDTDSASPILKYFEAPANVIKMLYNYHLLIQSINDMNKHDCTFIENFGADYISKGIQTVTNTNDVKNSSMSPIDSNSDTASNVGSNADGDGDSNVGNNTNDDEFNSITQLRERNKLLLIKLKNIQSAFNEERHKNSSITQKYINQKTKTEIEHEELVSLREALFIMQHPEIGEDAEEKSRIGLPYSVNRNIVVFGGPDNWNKSIKPLLPNVKFVGKDIKPHPDLIKNADVVWIQTNSLPHSYFNQIINEIRNHNKTCLYFAYPGAQKCAEQLAKHEENLNVK